MTMINIFAGCTTRDQALKALRDAQELGVATPEDGTLFELVFCSDALDKDVSDADTPSTPNGIKYSVFTGGMDRDDAIEKLRDIDGRIFDAKTYHHKSEIEQEQVGILSMLRREFADAHLQVIVLGNWVWIDKSSSLPRNIQLRLESHGFKFHAQRNRHYWKSKKERSRYARRMSNAELDSKYSSK